MTVDTNIIGETVKHYRQLHRLTMEELAALIGKGHSYISQLEAGKLVPGSDVLAKLSEVLGVSADTLLGRNADHDPLLKKLQQAAAALKIEDVITFLESLKDLPVTEQRFLARLARISALDHRMSAPQRLKVAEEAATYNKSGEQEETKRMQAQA